MYSLWIFFWQGPHTRTRSQVDIPIKRPHTGQIIRYFGFIINPSWPALSQAASQGFLEIVIPVMCMGEASLDPGHKVSDPLEPLVEITLANMDASSINRTGGDFIASGPGPLDIFRYPIHFHLPARLSSHQQKIIATTPAKR